MTEIWKFGGTSLRDAVRIRHVAELVHRRPGGPVVVVASARAGTTDALETLLESPGTTETAAGIREVVRAHREALDSLGGGASAQALHTEMEQAGSRVLEALARRPDDIATPDEIRALGEELSSRLLVAALRALGSRAEVVDPRLVVRTDAHFGAARPAEAAIRTGVSEHLRPLLAAGVAPVVPGFVGGTADGRTTTLGRGGSDLTATLLGAALDAPEVQIWTDVEGILTGDPRTVDRPRVLHVVGYEEAVELAWFGAKVLHPGAAKHSIARGVPVRIRSTFAPEHPGTLILRDRWGGPEIVAVAHKPHVVLITVRSRPEALPYGFLARVFEILARHELAVDLVATSHTSTAFTVDEAEKLDAVATELESVADVQVRRGMATVTVVGHGLLAEPGFEARVFRTVGNTPIHLISQASDVSLSFLVDAGEAEAVVARLHRALVVDAPTPAPIDTEARSPGTRTGVGSKRTGAGGLPA